MIKLPLNVSDVIDDVSDVIKPFTLRKRMDLILSSTKWTDCLLSMNHWNSDEKSLFKKFSIFLTSSCW